MGFQPTGHRNRRSQSCTTVTDMQTDNVAYGNGLPPVPAPRRRLACDPCRGRKIRCDRQQPVCSRCARLRHACTYSSPAQGTAAKVDLSRLLLQMQSRLAQAEAQLAQQQSVAPPTLGTTGMDFDWVGLDRELAVTAAAATSIASDTASGPLSSLLTPTSHILSSNDFTVGGSTPNEMNTEPASGISMADELLLDNYDDWCDPSVQSMVPASVPPCDMPPTQSFHAPPAAVRGHVAGEAPTHPASSAVSPSAGEELSATIMSHLHTTFFDVVNPIVGGMVNQARFQAEIAASPAPLDTQALSHALAALGALTSAIEGSVKEKCYNQGRELLDLCERDDSGRMLVSINTLQTCVLLALYEFKSPNFARLWMTLGRAIRLCKMMGLDTLDADRAGSSTGLFKQPPLLPFPLPPASSPAVLEERRRTFWILYIFDVSAAMRSPSAIPAFDAQKVSVRLPSSGDISQMSQHSDMPLVQQLENLDPATSLPPLAGTVFAGYVYRRLLEHVHLSHQHSQQPHHPHPSSPSSPSYPFWETHYTLDRLLLDCRSRISRAPPSPQDRVLHQTLQCCLASVEMLLHGTALSRAEGEGAHLPAALRTEAAGRCVAAARRVYEVIVRCRGLEGRERDAHRQSGECFIWPITSAVAILRMQQARGGEGGLGGGDGCGDVICVLVEALKELAPPGLIPDGVLDEPAPVCERGRVEEEA